MHLPEKEIFNLELYNYQNTYQKNAKILQILENTVNTYKYNTCIMQYLLCLEVCYLVLILWIVFSSSSSISNTQFAIYALGQVRSFHEQILLKIFCVKISLKNNHFCRSTITFIVNKQLFNLIFILIFIFYLYLLF